MFAPVATRFQIDNHLITFLQELPFFAEVSRSISKVATLDLPTLAIAYDPESDNVTLYYNPDFLDSLSNWQIRNVILHELCHLVYGHVTFRRKTPMKLWNVATDLAINSLIFERFINISRPRAVDVNNKPEDPLPSFVLLPGKYPSDPPESMVKPQRRQQQSTEARKLEERFKDMIANFPTQKASEWYWQQLITLAPPGSADDLSDIFIDSLDDHDSWDSGPESETYAEGRIRSIVERAIKFADSKPGSTGWGSMPHDLIGDLRRITSRSIDWRIVLRQFVGFMMRGLKYSSIRKINRRYPYIHSGSGTSTHASMLVAIDQSGSVSDEVVAMFFAELEALSKMLTIDIVDFDSTVGQVRTWKRGQKIDVKRTKDGGTSFDAPTELFNHSQNRNKWDALLIMTDGGASRPKPTRGKRAWILGPGDKLAFPTDELQIKIEPQRTFGDFI